MQPLLPEVAVEYLNDAQELRKNYLKAVSIRNCLEAIVDSVFVYIAKAEGKDKRWSKKKLVDKIEALNNFFPKEVLDSIHFIRKVTNKGAHQSRHKELTDEELSLSLENINNICVWVIISYFKKYGFSTESWVPTVLSTLQPRYRVIILGDVFNYFLKKIKNREELLHYQYMVQEWHEKQIQRIINGNIHYMEEKEIFDKEKDSEFSQLLLLVDKLAMAYVKNRQYEDSIKFIDYCHANKIINKTFQSQMKEKLLMLWEQIDNLPIATSLKETKESLKKILPAIRQDEHSLFIVIFTAIVAQKEIDKLIKI